MAVIVTNLDCNFYFSNYTKTWIMTNLDCNIKVVSEHHRWLKMYFVFSSSLQHVLNGFLTYGNDFLTYLSQVEC